MGRALGLWRRIPATVRIMLLWLLVVSLMSTLAALGYVLIEHWNFFDGFYMAVTILSSVGLKELRPMNRAGDVWTMLLAGMSVALIFGTVGIVAETIISNLRDGRRGARKMQKQVDSLRGHYIVCGFGRVGSLVARELAADGKDVVVLDANEDSRARALASGALVVPGDGTSDEVLLAAGVERAAGFVAAIDSDADNVYATISARALNPGLFIVARGSTGAVMHKLELAGADRAISPYMMAGRRAVQLATRPGVVDFIDAALSRGELSFTLEELEAGPGVAGFTVGDLRRRGLATMAIRHSDGAYEPNPPDERELRLGEAMIVSGSTAAIDALSAER